MSLLPLLNLLALLGTVSLGVSALGEVEALRQATHVRYRFVPLVRLLRWLQYLGLLYWLAFVLVTLGQFPLWTIVALLSSALVATVVVSRANNPSTYENLMRYVAPTLLVGVALAHTGSWADFPIPRLEVSVAVALQAMASAACMWACAELRYRQWKVGFYDLAIML